METAARKPPSLCLRAQNTQITPCNRMDDATLRDYRRDQIGRSHIKCRVVRGASLRTDRLSGKLSHLGFGPLLDHDRATVGGVEVYGRDRGNDDERYLMIAGEHGQAIRAHLVGHAAI